MMSDNMIAKRRFLKALFNLCLDHKFFIEGYGVETWMSLEKIDNNKSLYAILYDETTNRLTIDTKEQIYRLRHDYFPNAFIWEQEPY